MRRTTWCCCEVSLVCVQLGFVLLQIWLYYQRVAFHTCTSWFTAQAFVKFLSLVYKYSYIMLLVNTSEYQKYLLSKLTSFSSSIFLDIDSDISLYQIFFLLNLILKSIFNWVPSFLNLYSSHIKQFLHHFYFINH